MLHFLVLAVTIAACGPVLNVNYEAQRALILKTFKDTYFANSTVDEFDHFQQVFNNASDCWKSKVEKSPIFSIPREEFVGNAQKCFDDLIDEVEERLPEEAKDLPQRNMEVLFALFGFAYDQKDILFSPEFRSYIHSCLRKDEVKLELSECFSPTPHHVDVKQSCLDWRQFQKCLVDNLDKHCPTDDYKQMKMDFYAVVEHICADYIAEALGDDLLTVLPQATPNLNSEII